jgi:hypothetical protein
MNENIESLSFYRDEFLSDIVLTASVEKTFNEEMFITKACELISQDGAIDEPVLINHAKTSTKIHGYSYSNLDRSLSIFTANFLHIGEDWSDPQARGDVLKIIERGKRFVEKSLTDSFLKLLEPGLADFKAAKYIRNLIEAEQVIKI